jgi:PST family polysaccharide transporter
MMTLIKTSLINGIAVIIKTITRLVLNKILAIYVGPTGYAALGQFQNAVQMITTFASGAINTGVTKYTAEYYDDEVKQQAVWRTAGTIALCGSLVTALLVFGFNRRLAYLFLNNEKMGGVFIWFAATLILFVFNTLLLAILNGKKEIKRYVIANISGSLFSLIITSILVVQMGLYGALVALAIYQSLTFFVTLILTYKSSWFKLKYLFGHIDKQIAINLTKYTAMAIVSAVCVPLSHILIRNHLGLHLGWENAGYWEAMWRLSGAYLMLITTTLSVYFLPKFSELHDPNAIRQELIQGFVYIIPFTAISGLVIFIFRVFIIRLLFSPEFAPMEQLFAWQMAGDTLKIASFIIGYLFISKARYKLFIFIEVYFPFQFYSMLIYFVNIYGLKGAVFSYFLNYLICFLFVLYYYLFRFNR